jgi:apolipoprotein N-acyltransferase
MLSGSRSTVPNLGFQRETLVRLLICAASGACVTFCFEPFGLGFLAYVIFIPFIMFSGLLDGRGRYLLNSFAFGFCYFMGTLYWIAMLDREQITMPWLRLPAAVVLSLYLSLFVLLAGFLARRLIATGIPYQVALPVVWGGVEYLRSLGPLGFPWGSIAYSQTPYPAVIQQTALFGTYGMSAWLVGVNALIVWVAISRRKAAVLVLAAVFCLPPAGGLLVLRHATYQEGPEAALIQPDISGHIKWDEAFRDSTMSILTEMSLAAAPSRLIVWPETAVPFYARHERREMKSIQNLALATDSYILLGLPDFEIAEGGMLYYNSAMLVGPRGENLGLYRKIHLVPFGEMIPFEDRIDLLKRIDFGEGDFSAGRDYTILNLDGIPFGVAICFESIFPSLIRDFARGGARFIVNITNDAWFGPSPGPYQHAQMAVLRAVECRVGLIRCANTGISMVVDPYGRTVKQTALFRRSTLKASIPVGSGHTPYVAAGDVLSWLMLIGSLALALGRLRRKRTSQSV